MGQEELTLMLVFSPSMDGYWKYNSDVTMNEFVHDVFANKSEITYTRSWIARQAIKLEQWLNGLNGWQLGLLFVGVFGGLCGLMILLDYCCAPTQSIKTD